MNHPAWSVLFWGQSFAAGTISAFLAAYLWRYWRISEARPLVLLMAAISEWSFACGIEFLSAHLEAKLFWVRVEYVGFVFVGVLFLAFVLRMAGHESWLSGRKTGALCLIPLITIFGAVTNDLHHLVWSYAWIDRSGPIPVVAYIRGPIFWIVMVYTYVLLVLATLILFRALKRATGIHRKQLSSVVLALIPPWTTNALYLAGLPSLQGVDLTPFAFMLSGLLLAYGLFGYGLLDLRPVAREVVVESMADAVIVLDMQERVVDLNAAAAALADGPFQSVTGRPAREALPTLYPLLARYLEDVETETEVTSSVNGEIREHELRITNLFHRRGHLAGYLIMLRDITERKEAEATLRFTQFAIDHFSEAAFWLNPDGRFIYVNEAASRMLGYSRDELLGMTPDDVTRNFPRAYRKEIWADMHVQGFKVFESHLRHRDGRIIPVEISANLLEFKGVYYSCAFIRDIAWRKEAERERERLETRLQRARKMEAIGTLAGGVAHDLNNILSGIVTYPDLMLFQLPQDNPLRKPMMTIRDSGQKAAAIVQDLLTLARRGVRTMEVTRLDDVIHGYLTSPEHEKLLAYHPGVQVTTRIDGDLPPLKGSAVHLHKTVMNLVSNAAEAMPDGGAVAISLKAVEIDHPIRGYDEIRGGEYLRLSVSDDGVGIPPEERDRIFEPFYTKKVMGRSGTGLGMAVVWSTIRDHGGYIDVESEPDQGTTFHLYFPVSREQREEEAPGPGGALPEGKGESVLVVDDIREQREIAREILIRLGYEAAAVASGEEAVDYVKSRSVDLLLLDMIMEPGMDGLETYGRILRIRPGQRAIMVSGFSENDRVRRARELGAGPYLKKPYTLESLGKAVQRELEKEVEQETPPPKTA